ncbi:MAG: adenylate/guanylate cyclase domain-containing protein [Gammaproteobacteria bacterium]|nr:adenylate/guanylate cyclase domain-containing protein [Gammaproteobacteria bacterium]MDP2139286.1 adenylate/guanylate cyclase domain-containing protein [Gammaproteobacteria bacterium]MDP2346771.1 adenylate/guanylate cyclase domain-containing protein [Gammaproteobacteria bacterium]
MPENKTALRQFMAAVSRFLMKGTRLPVALGVLITLFVSWMQISPSLGLAALIDRLDSLIYDQRFNLMPKPVKNPDHKIVVVDLDERSLQAEGQFPWDRVKMGQLVEKLEQYGVLVTGFDITFPEPQRNLVRDLLSRVDDDQLQDGVAEELLLLEDELDADSYFARAIGSPAMDVVLALSFNPIEAVQYGALPNSIFSIDESIVDSVSLQEMAGYTGNIPVLQEQASGAGIMNQLPDVDGIVRRVPLVVRYQDQLYPTLALEMARVYFFEDSFELVTQPMGNQLQVEGIRIGRNAGQYELSTDARAQVLVPYVGRSFLSGQGQYPYVSATDVLNERIDPAILENALVLVGTTATGLLDLRSTPMEAVYPGVEVHANILNGILDSFIVQEVAAGQQTDLQETMLSVGRSTVPPFPYKPVWEEGAIAVTLVAAGFLLSLLLPVLGPAMLGLVAIGLVGLAIWGNFMIWSIYRMDISLTLILLLVILLSVVNMAYGFLSERLSRQTIKGMFDQYVPPAHIDAMLENPDAYSFAGESREMTVLFSDIRDFTSVSESLTATELKQLLNEFFTPVTGIIFDYNGTIDKYVGDMVMAFWGAPLEDKNHRNNAVGAALDILEKVEELRTEFIAKGLPAVSIGVGINTGMMNVGDMGSVYRRSYTVLGDSVNLGSRLEGLTKFYGVKLLIGEETFKNLDGFVCRLVDKVKVKGKDNAIKAYEPLCRASQVTPQLLQQLEQYHAALDRYFHKDWNTAQQHFETLHAADPHTYIYEIYLERIARLRHENLPDDWDGAFQHMSK